MRTLAIALTTALALTVGAVAVAGPPGFGPGPEMLEILRQLDLTPEQRLALRSLREAHQAEREAHRAEREETMAFFKAQLLSDTPDAAALHAKIDEKSIDAIERAHAHLDAVLEVHAVLTPVQRQQVADALEDARERHEAMRGPRGPRGPQ